MERGCGPKRFGIVPRFQEKSRGTADPSPSLRYGRDDIRKDNSSVESVCRAELPKCFPLITSDPLRIAGYVLVQ